MAYFMKLWTDILGDPKLIAAAECGNKHLDLLPWLMVFAKAANDGGRLSMNGQQATARTIAALIPDGNAKKIQECEASALAIGVLVRDDDGVARFANWAPRGNDPDGQGYRRPSDTSEARRDRKRKSRASHARDGHSVTRDTVTKSVTQENRVQSIDLENREKRERTLTNVTTVTSPELPNASLAAESVIARLGNSDRARLAVTAFLDRVPNDLARLTWAHTLNAGILDGLQMPHNTPPDPNELLVTLEQWPLVSMPLTPQNLIACVLRVARGESQVRTREESGNGVLSFAEAVKAMREEGTT